MGTVVVGAPVVSFAGEWLIFMPQSKAPVLEKRVRYYGSGQYYERDIARKQPEQFHNKTATT